MMKYINENKFNQENDVTDCTKIAHAQVGLT